MYFKSNEARLCSGQSYGTLDPVTSVRIRAGLLSFIILRFLIFLLFDFYIFLKPGFIMSFLPTALLTDSEFEKTNEANKVIIVRYGELSLKSKGVRDRYEQILKNNIQQMLEYHDVSFSKIQRDFGRIFIHSGDSKAAEKAALVFGVVSVSQAFVCSANPDEITSLCAKVGEEIIQSGETFAVRARRSGDRKSVV